MAKLLRIGAGRYRDHAADRVPPKKGVDVPLADYEADMLLKVAKK